MSTQTKESVQPPAKPIPDGVHSLTPYLSIEGANEAIKFYQKAFNATLICNMPTPDGRVMHGAMMIGDSMLMFSDAFPEWGMPGAKHYKGSPVTIHLYVEDADATFARAVNAGAKVIMPLDDAFWGDRYGKLEDPFGHQWSIATHIRDVSPEEMQKAAAEACVSDA